MRQPGVGAARRAEQLRAEAAAPRTSSLRCPGCPPPPAPLSTLWPRCAPRASSAPSTPRWVQDGVKRRPNRGAGAATLASAAPPSSTPPFPQTPHSLTHPSPAHRLISLPPVHTSPGAPRPQDRQHRQGLRGSGAVRQRHLRRRGVVRRAAHPCPRPRLGAGAPPPPPAARCPPAFHHDLLQMVEILAGATGPSLPHHPTPRPGTPPPSIAQVVEILADCGVKFIAMRCAGYDRVDVKAANAAGIQVGGGAFWGGLGGPEGGGTTAFTPRPPMPRASRWGESDRLLGPYGQTGGGGGGAHAAGTSSVRALPAGSGASRASRPRLPHTPPPFPPRLRASPPTAPPRWRSRPSR
jgi:hypothetical protein